MLTNYSEETTKKMENIYIFEVNVNNAGDLYGFVVITHKLESKMNNLKFIVNGIQTGDGINSKNVVSFCILFAFGATQYYRL